MKPQELFKTISPVLLLLAFLNSCNYTSKSVQTVKMDREFHFEDYEISKGRLGKIKLGTTIQSNTSGIHQMDVKQVPGYTFGYDGGGMAYLYSFKGEPVFALLPAFETDSIIAIVAIHEKLKGPKGIHPKMSVKQLQKHYPGSAILFNLMMEWEEMIDAKNNFSFVFMTENADRIGNYTLPGKTASVPLRNLDCKSEWITID